MTKKKSESTDEVAAVSTDSAAVATEPRYSIEQLRNSLSAVGCSEMVFDGAIEYAVKSGIIKTAEISVSEMKQIVNKWQKLPIE